MDYTGYKSIILDDKGLAQLYQEGTVDGLELYENEYLAVMNENEEIVDKFKMKNGELVQVPYTTVGMKSLEVMKPRNLEQYFAFDMLKDDSIPVKLITGKFGVGKSAAIVHAALELLDKGKYTQIIWIRNNVEVRDTTPLGALPGDEKTKLLPYVGPFIDAATEEITNEMIENGTLKVLHLGYLRGRDLRNSIIICSEAENLSKQHIQLIMGRISQGSILMMDADIRQRDKDVFVKSRGIETMIERLKGHPLFGYVHLIKSERSPASAMADLLDDD